MENATRRLVELALELTRCEETVREILDITDEELDRLKSGQTALDDDRLDDLISLIACEQSRLIEENRVLVLRIRNARHVA
jgi:hypothetical protein